MWGGYSRVRTRTFRTGGPFKRRGVGRWETYERRSVPTMCRHGTLEDLRVSRTGASTLRCGGREGRPPCTELSDPARETHARSASPVARSEERRVGKASRAGAPPD